MAYPESQNPFADRKDNDLFGNKGRAPAYGGSYSACSDDLDREFMKGSSDPQQKQQMIDNSLNRQMESTQRAMASIYDSERMGVATAEELIHQGEQLDNVERKTASINQMTKTSQKHINNIKSVFGGIKNWWQGKNAEEEAEEKEKRATAERLQKAIDDNPHPAYRQDVGPDYGDDARPAGAYGGQTSTAMGGSYGQSSGSGGGTGPYGAPPRTGGGGAYGKSQKSAIREYDAHVDDNLGAMSDGMSRLKNLAMGLGDEIEAQNDQMDRISGEVGKANIRVGDQNKQIRQILGK